MQLKTLTLPALVLGTALALAACSDDDGPLEEAGEELDETADEIEDAADDAGDDLEDAADDADPDGSSRK